MDLSGRLFLAVVEEDNTQRILFRVRPLLGEEGPVQQEELDELGDDGYLRVVPDRHEQHTFKERMRELGALCLINLRDTPPGLDKVRPNKNYAPQRGERNRFVIYSDAVRGLEDLAIYEVISEGRAAVAGTSAYYLRKGGHIQGPFDRDSGEPVDALSCIAPDNNRLFAVSMPDGRERLFYWPEMTLIALPQMQHTQKDEHAAEDAPLKEEVTPAAMTHAARIKRAAEALSQVVDRSLRRQRGEDNTAVTEEKPGAADSVAEVERASSSGTSFEDTAGLLHDALRLAGFETDSSSAANLLLHLLLFPSLRLTARYLSDARLAVRAIGQALGLGKAGADHRGYARLIAAQDTLLSDHQADDQAGYWPTINLQACTGFDIKQPDVFAAACDAVRLRVELQGMARDIPGQALALLEEAERMLTGAGHPLPLTLKLDLLRYLRNAPALLPGGVDTALDFGLCCWLVPFARQYRADTTLLRPLCANMPRALALL